MQTSSSAALYSAGLLSKKKERNNNNNIVVIVARGNGESARRMHCSACNYYKHIPPCVNRNYNNILTISTIMVEKRETDTCQPKINIKISPILARCVVF